MNLAVDAKPCSKCADVKPFTEFHRDRTHRDGRATACRECRSVKNRKYYEDNRESLLENAREYREDNREYFREYSRKYYEDNREARLEYKRKWYEDNREAVLEYMRKWSADNSKRRVETERRRRARKHHTRAMLSAEDWQRTLRRSRGRCYYCGERVGVDVLQQEHVIPLSRGGEHSVGNVVAACQSCNCSKSARFLMEWPQRPERIAG